MNFSIITGIAAAAIMAALPSWAQPPVPSKYQDLFTEVTANLTRFEGVVDSSWNGATHPVVFATELTGADSSQGPNLLRANKLKGIALELEGLKALGVKGVSVGVNFPMLYRPFFSSDQEYQKYLDFYIAVAAQVRASGLKLIVETQVLLSEPGWSPWNLKPYYDSLSLAQYRQGRMEVARTILQTMAPDYLNVIGEPDTEAITTGKDDLGALSGSTELLQTILNGLADFRAGKKIGAGFGTWMSSHLSWAESFAATSVDYVGLHIYPSNRDFLDRTIAIADLVRSYGKPVAIPETFAHKVRESELGIASFTEINRRNNFSFWEPVDIQHLRAMIKLSHFKGLEYLSAFWSAYFRAYLDYSDSLDALPAYELRGMATTSHAEANVAGLFTGTGLAFQREILGFLDTVNPAPPQTPTATVIWPSSVYLEWLPSVDNVGAVGSILYRDGVEITRGTNRYYLDAGLSDARTLRYTVAAWDARGNLSIPSLPAIVTTPDLTPPTAPTNLRATFTAPSTVDLIWNPASDNVGVTNYLVLRGSTPANLSPIGSTTTTSFTHTTGARNATFYYAVQAMDAKAQKSPLSNVVSITTPPGR